MSVLDAAMAIRRRRYGILRSLADYQLIIQAALLYAKQCDLLKIGKAFNDAVEVSSVLHTMTLM